MLVHVFFFNLSQTTEIHLLLIYDLHIGLLSIFSSNF